MLTHDHLLQFFLLTSSSSCLVLPGSPVRTSCLATAARTPASSRTSVRSARRSLPAVTTCPNTPRFTAAPGPVGLSEPPCDPLSWPRNRRVHKQQQQQLAHHSSDRAALETPSVLLVRRTWRDVEDSFRRADCCSACPPSLTLLSSSLLRRCNAERKASSGKILLKVDTTWPSCTHTHTLTRTKQGKNRRGSSRRPSPNRSLHYGFCYSRRFPNENTVSTRFKSLSVGVWPTKPPPPHPALRPHQSGACPHQSAACLPTSSR